MIETIRKQVRIDDIAGRADILLEEKQTDYAIANTISGQEIKNLRKSLELTQAEFAQFVNVSVKTIERWEIQKTPIKGEIVTLCRLIREDPGCIERFRIPAGSAPLRLMYGREEDVCTIIDVSPQHRQVRIYNYTKGVMCRAFGKTFYLDFDEQLDVEKLLESESEYPDEIKQRVKELLRLQRRKYRYLFAHGNA